MTRLEFIPAPTVRLAQAIRQDLTQFVVGGIHMPSGGEPRARVWKVNADFTSGGEVSFPNSAGKDDSIVLSIQADGSLLITISDAGAQNASGSLSKPECHRIAGVFPHAPNVAAGSAYIAAPGGGSIRVKAHDKTQPPWSGTETIHLPASVPTSATLLNLRVTASAATAGVRARVGPTNIMDGMLTAQTQTPNQRIYADGARPMGAGHTLILMADSGPLVECYVDVVGWWY